MATLSLKEMVKFIWEGSFALLAVSVHWENAKKKFGIMKSGLDVMPLFLLDDMLNVATYLNTLKISQEYCFSSCTDDFCILPNFHILKFRQL